MWALVRIIPCVVTVIVFNFFVRRPIVSSNGSRCLHKTCAACNFGNGCIQGPCCCLIRCPHLGGRLVVKQKVVRPCDVRRVMVYPSYV